MIKHQTCPMDEKIVPQNKIIVKNDKMFHQNKI